jgi:hypothetical protein
LSPTERSRQDFADIPFQSRAVGVLKLGEHEQPTPTMRHPNAACAALEDDAPVSESAQSKSESFGRPLGVGPDGGGVLSENKARTKLLNDPEKLSSERGRDRSVRPRVAVGLARITARDEVRGAPFIEDFVCTATGAVAEVLAGMERTADVPIVVFWQTVRDPAAEGSDVVVPGDVGPMLGEDGSAEGVDFDLSDTSHSGPLEAEVEAADAGEERDEAHTHHSFAISFANSGSFAGS